MKLPVILLMLISLLVCGWLVWSLVTPCNVYPGLSTEKPYKCKCIGKVVDNEIKPNNSNTQILDDTKVEWCRGFIVQRHL